MTITEIRNLLGISRAEFSRKYNIPIRTLENWESGKTKPPEWCAEMIERVVKMDMERENKNDNEL